MQHIDGHAATVEAITNNEARRDEQYVPGLEGRVKNGDDGGKAGGVDGGALMVSGSIGQKNSIWQHDNIAYGRTATRERICGKTLYLGGNILPLI